MSFDFARIIDETALAKHTMIRNGKSAKNTWFYLRQYWANLCICSTSTAITAVTLTSINP